MNTLDATDTRSQFIASLEHEARKAALREVYDRLNALGGSVRRGDYIGQGRMGMLDDVLDVLIEMMGGDEPKRFSMVCRIVDLPFATTEGDPCRALAETGA